MLVVGIPHTNPHEFNLQHRSILHSSLVAADVPVEVTVVVVVEVAVVHLHHILVVVVEVVVEVVG